MPREYGLQLWPVVSNNVLRKWRSSYAGVTRESSSSISNPRRWRKRGRQTPSVITITRYEGKIQQRWKDAISMEKYMEKDKTDYGIFYSVCLVSHAGKVPLKIIARRFRVYCKINSLLSEEQNGFLPFRTIIDMRFVVRRLQELGRKAGVLLFFRFIDI